MGFDEARGASWRRGWRGLEPEGDERRKKKKKTLKTREKKTTNKIINASATVTMHICMVTVAIVQLCITAQFDTH